MFYSLSHDFCFHCQIDLLFNILENGGSWPAIEIMRSACCQPSWENSKHFRCTHEKQSNSKTKFTQYNLNSMSFVLFCWWFQNDDNNGKMSTTVARVNLQGTHVVASSNAQIQFRHLKIFKMYFYHIHYFHLEKYKLRNWLMFFCKITGSVTEEVRARPAQHSWNGLSNIEVLASYQMSPCFRVLAPRTCPRCIFEL